MLANANVTSPTADGNITGVDFTPALTDDENAADEDAKDEENNDFSIDPPDDPLPELLEVEESDDDDLDNNHDGDMPFSTDEGGDVADDENSDEENDNMDVQMHIVPEGAQRRYPLRNRKKRIVIDFAGRQYHESDGIIHINPSVIDQGRESLKKGDRSLLYGIKNRPKSVYRLQKGRGNRS